MNKSLSLLIVGFSIFTCSLLYAFAVGNFSQEGSLILSMPWGIITLLDVYFMFFLFSAWIYHRERNKIVFLLWFVALLILGSFIAYLYTIQALITSRGLKPRFWHGERSVSV